MISDAVLLSHLLNNKPGMATRAKIWSLLFELIKTLFFDLCIQGVIQGAIYALIALGLTLVYGLLRILHVAHTAFGWIYWGNRQTAAKLPLVL